MKNCNKTLIEVCIVIYTCLFIVCGLLFTELKIKSNTPAEAIVVEAEIEETEVAVQPDEEMLNIALLEYVIQITSVNKDTTFQDAMNMVIAIHVAANRHNMNVIDAFTLVHVESDFNASIQRKDTLATGLCQITPICLAEYNAHNGTNYEINDMLDIATNLEVGFWYFEYLMSDHYGEDYKIDTIRDAYFAYNLGPTRYRKGYQSYRDGTFPNGVNYKPATRFDTIANTWCEI